MAYRTNLSTKDATFASMMENGFGIVTVMNAKIYKPLEDFSDKTAYMVLGELKKQTPICELDTLKIANVTQEGPTKTISGGKYSNALVKYGKSARLEMQDALGNAYAIESLCGGVREWKAGEKTNTTGLHFGEDFQGPKTIVGESFFIDRNTGKQVDVNIIFYQFLPDSIFNLTQDAEGDATVFDMNGDLLTTEVLLGTDAGDEEMHGVFYSIIEKDKVDAYEPSDEPKDEPKDEATVISPENPEGFWVIYEAASSELTIDGGTSNFVLTGPDMEKTPQAGGYSLTTFVVKGNTYSVIRVGTDETIFTITPGNTDLNQNNL